MNLRFFSYPAFRRSRSIAATVTGGLFLIGALFAAISIISLIGFVGFQEVLSELSNRTFARATNKAQAAILVNQLLQQTGSLHAATAHPERSVAYAGIQQKFATLSKLSTTLSDEDRFEQDPKLDNLSKILFELNDLVLQRIDVRQEVITALSDIRSRGQSVPLTGKTLTELSGERDTVAIDTIIEQVITSISEIPGEQGILPLIRRYQAIDNECDARNSSAQQLLQEKEQSTQADYLNLTSSVDATTLLLSDRVESLIRILTALFIASLFLSSAFFVYFRQVLIDRLLRLNRTVLAMVAGEKPVIAVEGSDEISEIARSVNYFSDEMHKAKEIAEKSAITKAEFLAHMSHEIRTPMNAILGFSDLALKTNRPEDHLDYLGKINNASYSLLGIINAVLDYSKIEAGKFTIENVPFDLRELLENLSTLISLRCEESGLEFYFHIEPETPYALTGDALRIGQVLTNLITNAFKFTKSGFIALHIGLPSELNTPDGIHVRLSFAVQDTGRGISEREAKNLFQPFNQADTSITRRFGGTGLGLAICKRLVEMMNGEIRLEKSEGAGSTFSFSLPLEYQDDNANHFFSAHGLVAGKRVIVMSDISQTATELSCQLTNFGLSVFQALSFEEVLSALEHQDPLSPYDIVVIDCSTYGQRFPELLRKIKLLTPETGKPALIMTGMRRLATHFSRKSMPDCDLFLAKPITPARLLHAILTVLELENRDVLPSFNDRQATRQKNSDHLAGTRVLLVEDNEINQQVALGFLNSLGLSVVVAWNGAEALDILRRPEAQGFDLILMDLQMPVMDGYTATRAIRQLPPPVGTLPIIAVTAHAMQEDREKCLKAGISDYITKPINPDALVAALSKNMVHPAPSTTADQPPTTAALPEEFLGSHAGIDLQAGLARVVGDRRLYMELLQTFLSNYGNYPNSMREELKKRSFETLRRMAHTLKGVSGNLGMTRLFSHCGQLDLSIKRKKLQECNSLLLEIDRENEKVCTFLRQYLDNFKDSYWNIESPGQQQVTDTDNHHALLADLSDSLKNNSSKALKQIHRLRADLDQEDHIVFSRIEKHINDLDFAKAHLLLRQWQSSLSENRGTN